MFERLTQEGIAAVAAAGARARRGVSAPVIEPDHLLLALTKQKQTVASDVLAEFGLSRSILKESDTEWGAGTTTWSPLALEAFRLAEEHAGLRGPISTGDLLLGLVELAQSGLWQAPSLFGDLGRLRGPVQQRLEQPIGERPPQPRKGFVLPLADSDPAVAVLALRGYVERLSDAVARLAGRWPDGECDFELRLVRDARRLLGTEHSAPTDDES